MSLDDVESLAAFAEAQQFPYGLLSDPDGSAARKYAVLPEKGRFTKRVTFVIDDQGVVRAIDESVKVDSHGEDLAMLISKLRG